MWGHSMESGTPSVTNSSWQRTATLVALGASLLIVVVLSILLGLSFGREAELYRELDTARSYAASAHRAVVQSKAELERGRARQQNLEDRTERQDAAISDLRAQKAETRKSRAASEKEVGILLRSSEDKSEELIRRHNRILELQTTVEKLTQENERAIELSSAREERIRREYEAALSNERSKRQDLESRLRDLDEIAALKSRLKRLVEAMEEASRSE